LSLPAAARGEKAHLRPLWESSSFDFELACRTHGRNDAFWVLCYRAWREGEELPGEAEIKKIVRTANRATAGLNQQGERERYTRYEAEQTIDQVKRYRSCGLLPMLRARRQWAASSRSKYATPTARRLLNAICDIAEACCRVEEIRTPHRQLAEMADLHPTEVASLLYSLQSAGQVFRLGFTPCYQGRPRGTTRVSLKPPEPGRNIDERERPAWNPRLAKWSWGSPLAKGKTSYKRWRWLARQQPSAAARVPYVYRSSTSSSESCISAFKEHPQIEVECVSSRGSP
jgi:hypothetical protein